MDTPSAPADSAAPLTLRDKLASEVAPTPWSMLEVHQRRGAVFVVDAQVDLVDVAVAMAEDRTDAVKEWLDAAQIARPRADQVEAWAAEAGTRFIFVIVQPYVLVQRLELDEG